MMINGITPSQARGTNYTEATALQDLDLDAVGDTDFQDVTSSSMQQSKAQQAQLNRAISQLKSFGQQLSTSTEQQEALTKQLGALRIQLALPKDASTHKQLLTKISEKISTLCKRNKLENAQIKSLLPMLKVLAPSLHALLASTPQASTLLQPLQLLLQQMPASTTSGKDPDPRDPDSDSVLFDHIVDIIGQTHQDNEVFSKMVEGFVEYYDKISKFDYTKYFATADKDGNISVDFSALWKDFENNYAGPAADISLGKMTPEQYAEYGKKLFGSDYQQWITQDADGNVHVAKENPAVVAMERLIKPTGPLGIPIMHKSPLTSAESNAWSQHFDARMTEISNHSNDIAQKLSRQNNVFDNLIKVLTSTISALKDANMAFTSKL